MYNPLLETFVQVVECGSFSKAAKKLYISDVSVGKQIRSLENHFGFSLFKRTNQGVLLTPAGQIIYEDSKEMIFHSNKIIEKAKKLANQESYTIRIGTSLLRPYQAFMNIWSKINDNSLPIQIEIIPFENDPASLKNIFDNLGFSIDCVISPYNEQIQQHFQIYHLGFYKCCIALSRRHKLAKSKTLSLNDLNGENFILAKRGSSRVLDEMREEIEKEYPNINIIDTPYMYDTSIFNTCEKNSYVMESLESWDKIHPSLVSIPMNWNYKIPFGIIYSEKTSRGMQYLINYLNNSNI